MRKVILVCLMLTSIKLLSQNISVKEDISLNDQLKTTLNSYSVISIPYAPSSYTTGISVLGPNQDDKYSDTIGIGFNFCYYGNTFSKLVISSNGQITFDLSRAKQSSMWTITSAFPSQANNPPNTICAPFRDIDVSSFTFGTIHYNTSGTSPNRSFTVSWDSIPMYGASDSSHPSFCLSNPKSTFQVILYENSSNIDINIKSSVSCTGWNNGSGIIGIQSATPTNGICAPNRNYPGAWSAVNESWRFYPLTSCLSMGINNLELNNVAIFYPNPSNGEISVKIDSEVGVCNLMIFNSLGLKVFEQEVSKEKNNIDLKNLNKNVYYYTLVKNKQQIQKGKLLIE